MGRQNAAPRDFTSPHGAVSVGYHVVGGCAPYPELMRWGRKSDVSIDALPDRVRLLSAELDNIRAASLERTKLLNTKASFVVVAAGLIGSASSTGVRESESALLWLIPFGLTFLTVLTCTITLWPKKLRVAGAEGLVGELKVSESSRDEAEDFLLRIKVEEVKSRDEQYKVGSRWVKIAFVLLLLSLVSVVAVATTDALVTSSSPSQAPAPTPSEDTNDTQTHLQAGGRQAETVAQ